MKVSFTGTGCSGKSTLLNLCREQYGDKFSYVTEVTRPLARKGFTINEAGGDATQKAIIDAHIENNKLNDVIMDRCIVDGYVYTSWLYGEGNVTQPVYDYAWMTLNEIINDIDIIFHTAPLQMEDDGQRSTNIDFQKDISDTFDILLNGIYWRNTYKGRVIYLEGEIEKRFNDIKIAIEQHDH